MLKKNFFKEDPFLFDINYHNRDFKKSIYKLTLHHYDNCLKYNSILKNLRFTNNKKIKLEEIPMLPVRLFKNYDLFSVNKKKIVKTLTSSGTTNSNVSKIFLDSENAKNQVKALKNLVISIIGNDRIPMLIVDKDPKVLDRKSYSAKTAAILGFSYFGKNHFYLMDKQGKIDYDGLNLFLKNFSKDKFFIFGFTSLIYEILLKNISTSKINSDFSKGILLHGGGWKKLEKLKISNSVFKFKLIKKFHLKKVFNYYGMVEQTGSIFLECNNCGGFKTSRYSEIIIRDKHFNSLKVGQKGMIQLISNLPTSYPGHSILTEDSGEIIKNGNCMPDFHGKCFLVHGRLEKAELRGCSDVR
jgi:hypothetical protein